MKHYIVTDFTDPIKVGSCRGSITPLELKVWSGQKRHSGIIATYAWKSKPRTTISVPLKDDKTYTFDTLARLFNEQLNEDIAKALKIKGNTSNSGRPLDVDKIYQHKKCLSCV